MAKKPTKNKREVEPTLAEEMGNAASRYSKLETLRTSYLKRARDASQLTIPSLVPPQGASSATELYKPFQSMGARGVNNLASKLLLSLFPSNTPFFKLTIDEFELAKAVGPQGASSPDGKTMLADMQEGLAKIERAVMSEIDSTHIRVQLFEALKHLIVAGNVCLYMPKDGGIRVFHLDRYVCKRDPMGNLTEIIVKETVDPDTLDQKLEDFVMSIAPGVDTPDGDDQAIDLFTHVLLEDGKWYVQQEVKGQVIPWTVGTYGTDNFPWIVLRYAVIGGEDYGRGFVEEYQGDLYSLEGLAQAIVEGSAAAAKVLFLVDPNGSTSSEACAEATNGAFIEGMARDVTALQLQKQADLQVAANTSKEIQNALAYAFLLNSAIQRNGERVTAEEIRTMVQELESSLGGVYSVLSQDLQLPLAKRLMAQMAAQKRLPLLPKKIVRPTIATGVEALGRGNDLAKLDQFIGEIGQQMGPQVLAQYINVPEYLSRRASALGVDAKGLVKDQAQIQQEQQQAQQQQMLQQAVPNGVKAIGDMAKQHMANVGAAQSSSPQ